MKPTDQVQDVEIVQDGETLPALLAQDQVLMSVRRAKERIAAFVLIKQYALQTTNANDWAKIGDAPYLEDTGAEKIAGLFAPEIGKPEIRKETFPDGHYMYTCDGVASWGGKTIPVMGTRSTHDKFFIEYDYELDEKGDRKKDDKGRFIKIELSTEELLLRISAGNVRKSALTNYRCNAIKDVLGLEGITWEELETFAGIKKEDVGGYDFKQQEMGDEEKDQVKETERMLIEMHGDYSSVLEEMTTFQGNKGQVPGKRKVSALSEKQIPHVYRKVKEAYSNWQKAKGKQASTQPGEQPETVLLGIQSKEYKIVKDEMDKATGNKDRLDNLLGTLSATFNQAAIKGLTAYAKSKEKAL